MPVIMPKMPGGLKEQQQTQAVSTIVPLKTPQVYTGDVAQKSISAPLSPQTQPTTPMGAPVTNGLNNPNNNYWDQAGTNLGEGTEKVINDMATGAIFGPYAAQQREAQVRREANARAATAGAIHQAGFSGTAIGAGAGNATEAQIARDRFDNNMNLEVARNDARLQGAQAAMGYAQAANQFERDDWNFREQQYDKEGDNFSSYVMAHPELESAVAAAARSNDPAQQGAVINSIRQTDPTLDQQLQKMWGRAGEQGAYSDAFAWNHLNGVSQTTNPGRQIETFASSIFPDDPEMAKMFTDSFINGTLAESMGIKFVEDGEGGFKAVRLEGYEKQESTKEDIKQATAGIKSGQTPIKDYIFKDGYDDPVYKALLDESGIPDGVGVSSVVGQRKGTVIHGSGFGRKPNPGTVTLPVLDEAYTKGTPARIDGKLYYIKDVSVYDGTVLPNGGLVPGERIYTLVDPVTGKTITKNAAG